MSNADPIRDLELLVRSRYGLIVIDTAEDERAVPDADARRAILTIHLKRRGQDPGALSLDALIDATMGSAGRRSSRWLSRRFTAPSPPEERL
jgi:hypothetical protein